VSESSFPACEPEECAELFFLEKTALISEAPGKGPGELLRRALMAMDAGEFRRLVETHQRMVFSLALRVTGEHGTAEEVAQDAFLELFRALGAAEARLESEDHVRFWLRRVTVHRATDALRRRAVRPEAEAEEWMEEQYVQEGSERLSAAVVVMLEEMLRTLPEAMRVAVVLRYQEEMSPDEIAKLLVQPVATVKSNLQRGLQLLRRKAAVTMKEYVR
jgi:RNA polymerase sigma-70 factor (ECF subfamily)